jgi:hypothetical protein
MAHSLHVFGVMEAFGRMKVATTLLDEIAVLLTFRLVLCSKSADEGGVECIWTALGSFGCSSHACPKQERLCASADPSNTMRMLRPFGMGVREPWLEVLSVVVFTWNGSYKATTVERLLLLHKYIMKRINICWNSQRAAMDY